MQADLFSFLGRILVSTCLGGRASIIALLLSGHLFLVTPSPEESGGLVVGCRVGYGTGEGLATGTRGNIIKL